MGRSSFAKKYILPGILLLILLSVTIPTAAQPLVVDASLLNVRSGAGTNHAVVTQIPRGTVVMAVDEGSTWTRVILPDGKSGWVSSQYAKTYFPPRYAIVDTDSLNVRSGPGTNNAIVTQLSRNAVVAVLQEQNTWLRVILPNGSQGWLAGWLTQSADFRSYVSVTASLLNLRSGAGTGFSVAAQLPKGEVLAVLAQEGSWLKVARLNGTLGWVSASYTTPAGSQPVSPPSTPPSSPPVTTSPVAGKRIVIDAGHGGYDPGAVGINGYYEKTVNLAVALELAPMLKDAGATVLLTRWSDWGPSLWERVNLANSNNAHVFVSIHANAHPQSSVSGTETYYYPWSAHSNQSRLLAEHLQSQLVSVLKIRNIGVKTQSFYVISNSQMPSALVELAFLSNYGDEALLRQPQTHRNSAEALFRGLESFFR